MENKFSQEIESALIEVSDRQKLKLSKKTHYESDNRQLKLYSNKRIDRLDFNIKDNKVSITHYRDIFKISCIGFLEWCHNYIPLFPYFANIKWEKVETLKLGKSKEEYVKDIDLILSKIDAI